jgi:hypothetical protein
VQGRTRRYATATTRFSSTDSLTLQCFIPLARNPAPTANGRSDASPSPLLSRGRRVVLHATAADTTPYLTQCNQRVLVPTRATSASTPCSTTIAMSPRGRAAISVHHRASEQVHTDPFKSPSRKTERSRIKCETKRNWQNTRGGVARSNTWW